ncbi:MAG: NEW3 domain-containing protein [Stellaceae bacterium]
MRYLCPTLGFLAAFALSLPAVADTPASVKGLWITTDYPATTVRAGESTTLKLKVQNYNLAPESVALEVNDVPAGWKATILGGGAPIAAAMPGTNENVPIELKIEIPAGATAGSHKLTLIASGADASAQLPLDVTVGENVPPKLSIKSKLPSIRGTPHSSFAYDFTVTNDGDKDQVVNLAAAAPPGFQTSFTESYGTQEITSIPIPAGQSKDLKVKVQPPSDGTGGTYPVKVRASAGDVAAETSMTMQIVGQPQLRLTGQGGRLSAHAEAGKATPISLTLSNDGTAPARNVELSGSPPSDWKVEFQPSKIDALAPKAKQVVQALLTPSAKALAGDYMTTLRAGTEGDSSSADFRITVSTSTLWGIVGAGIIAAALLVAVGAVARFGRR